MKVRSLIAILTLGLPFAASAAPSIKILKVGEAEFEALGQIHDSNVVTSVRLIKCVEDVTDAYKVQDQIPGHPWIQGTVYLEPGSTMLLKRNEVNPPYAATSGEPVIIYTCRRD